MPQRSLVPGHLATVIQTLRHDVHELDQVATRRELALEQIKGYRVTQDVLDVSSNYKHLHPKTAR